MKHISDHPLFEESKTCASELLSLCRRYLNKAWFDQSLIMTQFTALDLLLLGFSGGDVYPCQAYDRIFVTTEQLSELDKL